MSTRMHVYIYDSSCMYIHPLTPTTLHVLASVYVCVCVPVVVCVSLDESMHHGQPVNRICKIYILYIDRYSVVVFSHVLLPEMFAAG